MNKLTDPSREIGVAWQDIGAAQRRNDLGAHTGSWAGYLFARKDAFAGNQSSTQRQDSVALSIGVPHAASLWVNGDALGNTTINCEVDPGDGVFTVLGTLASAPPGWSLWEPGSIVAVGPTGRFQVTTPVPATDGSGYWLVDDLSLDDGEDILSKLRDIRAAIIASLEGMTIAGGYSVNAPEVYRNVLLFGGVQSWPAFTVRSPSWEKERGTLGRKVVTATFPIRVFAFGDDSEDQVLDLAKDVERKLEEITGGQFLGIGYVTDVNVNAGEPSDLEEGASPLRRLADLTATVVFYHDRRDP